MSTVLPSPARVIWDYADLQQLPNDGNRYEVIDGELIVTPSPTTTHQRVSKRIQLALMLQVEQAGNGVVFNAPCDVILADTRVAQPDLLVVLAARRSIITERGIEGAPDLVVEILSPATATVDRGTKQKLYATVGVREYWLVDSAAHVVEVLELTTGGFVQRGRFGPGDRVASGLFELELEVDPIFAP